ncbi:MAG: ABC transporter ATP-binding protein [Actinomycetia bacterium]|nr:ABC transporter ATP-binding protein [bacterium]MCG2791704.1 ABC transporter ATP-binding protein [Actinomycetes bacterium]
MDAKCNLITLKNITKFFPGTIANDHIDMELANGEVLALFGENGAGKTTLMSILYGLYQPDEGEIFIKREQVKIRSPHDAMEYGIGMIHQHFTLVPVHTVVENIILGTEKASLKYLNIEEKVKKIEKIGNKYGLEVDPFAIIRQLPVGMQQRVEILKALYREARILIMDEPTSVLTSQETEKLFNFIRDFKTKGHSVIFISHKLNEVMEIADRITVLRDGKVVGNVFRQEASESQLTHLMIGRDLIIPKINDRVHPKPEMLKIENLTIMGDRKSKAIDDLSFTVREGEIFGIAGVSGNGQEELAQALCGLRKAKSGQITLSNKDITNKDVLSIIHQGVGYIPADRHKEGLVLDMSIEENLFLKNHSNPSFLHYGFLNQNKIQENARNLMRDFEIKAASSTSRAMTLSGGNQQKVAVAREINIGTKLLVAVQPTRGLDLGAVDYVHKTLLKEKKEGKAILLISTEFSEIMTLSDRIGVMYRGKLLKIVQRKDAKVNEIGLLMAGITEGKKNGKN